VKTTAIYIHIPFCPSKCSYCSFNSYAGLQHLHDAYVRALTREIAESASEPEGGRVASIYVGGGTPTVLSIELLERILRTCRESYWLLPDAEVTLEANPGTVDPASLRQLRAIGVNRLSLGVQSFRDGMLSILGRVHTAEQARDAFLNARSVGFQSISIDLIYGLPGQSLHQWSEDLGEALDLTPDHVSLYGLSLDDECPMAKSVGVGELAAPDPDLAAMMYEHAEATLEGSGYMHYEISNWALPGHECQHNLTYWRNRPYLGFGAGAHSYDGMQRRWNVARPEEYLRQMEKGKSATAGRESLDLATERSETMILGLRLCNGMALAEFEQRFGVSPVQEYADQIADLIQLGLLELDGTGIRLTPRGRLLGNEVFERFLPEADS
jgi:oxygen-independent coproporphyrinogen-3 oxidase